ncbi:hypothetical protein HFD88_006123 [Aspergillus terreus]|nr:hypothetical protein HFD88_006123 [Aspergillus terreus]
MANIPTAGIIVIVIVACLAVVSLGAALFKHYAPDGSGDRFHYSPEQQQYMRAIRLKTLGQYRRESMMKDVESGYTVETSSRY